MGSDREKKVILSMEEYQELLKEHGDKIKNLESLKEEIREMHENGMFCTKEIVKCYYGDGISHDIVQHSWSNYAKELESNYNKIQELLSKIDLLKTMSVFQFMKWRKYNG